MITAKIQGGIGNQMFQYALSRHLTVINDSSLSLDLTFAYNKSLRQDFSYRGFPLSSFNVQHNLTSISKLAKNISVPGVFPKMSKLINETKESVGVQDYIRESVADRFGYNETILAKRGNLYLDGYWQNEKYFKKIRELLIQEFTLVDGFDDSANEIADKIKQTRESVSIHIRRGDYVGHPRYKGICTKQYYKNAISFFRKNISKPMFFIFTDDVDYVKKELNIEGSVFVSRSEISLQEDLKLMSICNHNIIANSTFGWWGAWLNENEDKLVVTPSRWVNDSSNDGSSIIPDNWTII